MAEETARRARVERLLGAARQLADPRAAEGRRLRVHLLETSGLSAPNIELGLARCLETDPDNWQLDRLLASTPSAPRAHVLLSSNVFVAALRAIAIGVAASADVAVRASRRDPALAQALHRLAPELFQLEDTLSPAPGDHLWAYGSDQTLADLRASLPRGVWFHGHGFGFGAVAVEASTWVMADARAIALDTALFDRQGCLSPHVVCVAGNGSQTREVAEAIAAQLALLEHELPAGPKSPAELARARRDRDAARYAFELFDAGSGWVSFAAELVVPPVGRNLHVVSTADPCRNLVPFTRHLTCVATNDAALRERLAATFPDARLTRPGQMQRPSLDGPVDRRRSPRGERLSAELAADRD